MGCNRFSKSTALMMGKQMLLVMPYVQLLLKLIITMNMFLVQCPQNPTWEGLEELRSNGGSFTYGCLPTKRDWRIEKYFATMMLKK